MGGFIEWFIGWLVEKAGENKIKKITNKILFFTPIEQGRLKRPPRADSLACVRSFLGKMGWTHAKTPHHFDTVLIPNF